MRLGSPAPTRRRPLSRSACIPARKKAVLPSPISDAGSSQRDHKKVLLSSEVHKMSVDQQDRIERRESNLTTTMRTPPHHFFFLFIYAFLPSRVSRNESSGLLPSARLGFSMDRLPLPWEGLPAIGSSSSGRGLPTIGSASGHGLPTIGSGSANIPRTALEVFQKPSLLTSADAKRKVLCSDGTLEARYVNEVPLTPDALSKLPGDTPDGCKLLIMPSGISPGEAYASMSTSPVICVHDLMVSLELRANWFIRTTLIAWFTELGVEATYLQKKLSEFCHKAHKDASWEEALHEWENFTYVRLCRSLNKTTGCDPVELGQVVEEAIRCARGERDEVTLVGSQEYETGAVDEPSIADLVSNYETCKLIISRLSLNAEDELELFINVLLYMTEVALIRTSTSGIDQVAQPVLQPAVLRWNMLEIHYSKAQQLERHTSAHPLTILLEEKCHYSGDSLVVEPDIVTGNQEGNRVKGTRKSVPYEPPASLLEQKLEALMIRYRLAMLSDVESSATRLLEDFARVPMKQELVTMAASWWRERLNTKLAKVVAEREYAFKEGKAALDRAIKRAKENPRRRRKLDSEHYT